MTEHEPSKISGATTLKVLHIIESLGRGGAEQLLVTLLPELQKQDVDVIVVVRAGSMDLLPVLQSKGIVVHRLMQRHRWNLIGSARELSGIARSEGSTIIHAHLYFPAVTTALMKILRLRAISTCMTFHNLAYAGANRPGLKLTVRRLLARVLYPRGIDAFFGVSEAVADHYENKLGLASVTVIPNPVDFATIKKASAPGSPSDADIVLAGRMVPEKGHSDFLEALAQLASRGLHPTVIIAGDGPLRSAIESEAERLGLSPQISFTGALAHNELLRVIGSADIAVVPSRFEGFGLVALEAMALGRAVIASDAGGLPEVLGDAGMIFPAGEPSLLAKAIASLLSDPERRTKLGASAAIRAMEFNLPHVAAKQIAAYRRLLGDHKEKGGKGK